MRKNYVGVFNMDNCELDVVKIFLTDLINNAGYQKQFVLASNIFHKTCPFTYYDEHLLNNFIDFSVNDCDKVSGPCIESAWSFQEVKISVDFDELFGSVVDCSISRSNKIVPYKHIRVKGFKSCGHISASDCGLVFVHD